MLVCEDTSNKDENHVHVNQNDLYQDFLIKKCILKLRYTCNHPSQCLLTCLLALAIYDILVIYDVLPVYGATDGKCSTHTVCIYT